MKRRAHIRDPLLPADSVDGCAYRRAELRIAHRVSRAVDQQVSSAVSPYPASLRMLGNGGLAGEAAGGGQHPLPTCVPAIIEMTTNASQPMTAFLRCWALQQPIRAAMLLGLKVTFALLLSSW